MNRRRPHRAAGFAGAAAVSAGGMAGPGVIGPGGCRPGVSADSTAQPVCRLIVGPPEGRRGEGFPGEGEGCGHSRPGPSSPPIPALTFRRLTGTEEISRLHAWEVDVVSPAPALDPPRWLGRHGTVVMRLDDGGAGFEGPGGLTRRGVDGGEPPASARLRYLDGLITRIGMREGPVELSSPPVAASTSPPIALFPHRLLLRPWLWLATRRSHVRVFEGLAAPAILAQVLAPYGHPLSLDRLTRRHSARPRTLQCGETDFDFIARLCEDEGIYWFFEHQAGGHGLVFADGEAGASRSSAGVDWVIPFLGPRPPQPGSQAQAGSVRFGRSPVEPHVDYWAMGREAAVADTLPGGLRAARFNAHLNHRGVAPGRTMALRGHPQADPNEAHLVVAVDYHLEEAPGWDGAQLASGKPADTPGHAAGAADASSVQRFAMEVHPLCVPFQPEPQAVRPVVRGPQVGSVVAVEAGAASRVKVRWRLAEWEPETDGLVTDWIPVGPAMGCGCVGGEGCRCRSCAPLGVGEAVLLDFMDGDPERPVCQGRWGGVPPIGALAVRQQGFDRLSPNGGRGLSSVEEAFGLR